MTNEQPCLTVRQVADRLRVTPRAIQQWLNAGSFPNAYRLNPHLPHSPWRIPVADVDAIRAQRKQVQP